MHPYLSAIANSRRRAAAGIAVLATTITTSGGAGGATTPAMNTVGASILIVSVTAGGTAGTLTDSAGNTWTALTAYGTSTSARLYYCLAPTTSGTHTFTFTGTNTFPVVGAIAASGVTAFSEQSGNSGTAVNVTPALAGTLSTSLVVTCHNSWTRAAAATIDSGFSSAQKNFAGGTNYGGSLGWKITATPVSPTWSTASSSSYATAIASFV